MSEPFLSEIKIVSFNFPPKGWAACNGQILPINQNQALFSLLGTTYGGNGQTTFALPNLKGRVPIHMGDGHTLGETAGASSVTITLNQLPQHVHPVTVTTVQANTTDGNVPTNQKLLAASNGDSLWKAPANLQAMNPAAVGNVGGSQAHENRMPLLVLNFIIALQGIFPSRN